MSGTSTGFPLRMSNCVNARKVSFEIWLPSV